MRTTDELLERGVPHLRGTHTVEDLKQAIVDGEVQLWRGRDSILITEVSVYPRMRVCRIVLAVGDMAELVDEVEPTVCAWARENQCSRVEITGRRGWQRVLQEYTQPHLTLSKELESDHG